MNYRATVQEQTDLLSRLLHHLFDRSVLHLFQLASEEPWKKRICFSSVETSNLPRSFWSTVAVSPGSPDVLLSFLTRSAVRFQSEQEPQRVARRTGLSIDLTIDLARKSPTEMDSTRGHATDNNILAKRATYRSLHYDRLEHMENVPSNGIMDRDQSSVACTLNRGG